MSSTATATHSNIELRKEGMQVADEDVNRHQSGTNRSTSDAAIARKRDAIDLSVPVTVALLGVGELDDVELTASTVEPGR